MTLNIYKAKKLFIFALNIFLTPSKAAFTLICILIVYILLVNKTVYKWPQLYNKT